jgi:hypothetical protein
MVTRQCVTSSRDVIFLGGPGENADMISESFWDIVLVVARFLVSDIRQIYDAKV